MKKNPSLFVILLPAILLVTTSCREGIVRKQSRVTPAAEKMPFMDPKLPID